MVQKLIADFKKSKYRPLVLSFLTSVIFVLLVCLFVLIIGSVIAVLMPILGPGWTVFLLSFCFLWFFVHKVLDK